MQSSTPLSPKGIANPPTADPEPSLPPIFTVLYLSCFQLVSDAKY